MEEKNEMGEKMESSGMAMSEPGMWSDLKKAVPARHPSNITQPKESCIEEWEKPLSRLMSERGKYQLLEHMVFFFCTIKCYKLLVKYIFFSLFSSLVI